jgi:hypothetical protein
MAQVLGLVDLGEQDPRTPLLHSEVLDRWLERGFEDVVREQDEHPIAVDEPLCEPERLRDPPGFLLVGVEQALDAVLVAVPEQPEELAGVRATGYAPTSASIAYVTIGRS